MSGKHSPKTSFATSWNQPSNLKMEQLSHLLIPYVLILLVNFVLSATARQDGLSLLLYKSVALVILSQAYSESFGYTLETKRPELLSRQVRALYILYRDPSDHRLSSRYLSIITFPLLLNSLKGLEKLALRGHWCRQLYNMHPDPSSSITDLILIEPHTTLKACTCINFRCVPCTSLIPITSSPQHLGHSGIFPPIIRTQRKAQFNSEALLGLHLYD